MNTDPASLDRRTIAGHGINFARAHRESPGSKAVVGTKTDRVPQGLRDRALKRFAKRPDGALRRTIQGLKSQNSNHPCGNRTADLNQ